MAPPDAAVYDRADDIERHAAAVATLQALVSADQDAGTQDPRRCRDLLLMAAALYDRYALAMGDLASDVVLTEALEAANAVAAWDRHHGSSAGPVPSAASRWSPRSYVRNEFGAHLAGLHQELPE
ncbi:hypothetical protein ACFWNK_35625 [Streptomyces sp. NPDC058417]